MRNAKLFSRWLKGQTAPFRDLNQRWVVIFDHLSKPGVSQEALDLALELGQRAFDRELTNIWVVLIDCPPVENLSHPGRCEEEIVSPISKEQVEKFLAWIREARKMAGDLFPDPPGSLTDLLKLEQFPLPKEQLRNLEQAISTWWSTPPDFLGENQ